MHRDLLERLENIRMAIERLFQRNECIISADDYYRSPLGMEKLESSSMLLIAIGESLKGIDRITGGDFLPHYPSVNWKQAKGLRDVIAHNYFQLDGEIILDTIRNDIPIMLKTVNQMIEDVECKKKLFKGNSL